MGQLIWAGFLTLKKQCELVRAQALAPDECRKSCGLALCPRAALGPNCGDYTEVGDSCGACEDPIGPKTARRLRIYGFTPPPPPSPGPSRARASQDQVTAGRPGALLGALHPKNMLSAGPAVFFRVGLPMEAAPPR